MRSRVVIANWKMHGSSAFLMDMAAGLNAENNFGSTDLIAICPPAVYLQPLRQSLKARIGVGAQNLNDLSEGAYTGEISGPMLLDVGCEWVLVGHSERRQYYAESNEWIADKAFAALDAGLNTVLCVGETLEDRQQGHAKQVVSEQLAKLLQIKNIEKHADRMFLAYEPVWAIGTGETASPEQAQEMHSFIRSLLPESLRDVAILYGGSVKPENAQELFSQSDIDGGLIGGASLVLEEFIDICRAMPASGQADKKRES
jgi:triosephosphate isomerase (TIM)